MIITALSAKGKDGESLLGCITIQFTGPWIFRFLNNLRLCFQGKIYREEYKVMQAADVMFLFRGCISFKL